MSLILLYNSLSRGLQHYKELTDFFLSADNLSTQVIFNFTFIDSANLNDTRVLSPSLVFNSSMSYSDMLQKKPILNLLESLKSYDYFSLRPGLSINDNIYETDTIDKISSYNRGFLDNYVLNDPRSSYTELSFLDSLSLSEIRAHQYVAYLSFLEKFSLSDAINTSSVIHREFFEAMGTSLLHNKEVNFNRDYTGTLLLSDVFNKLENLNMIDSLNIKDKENFLATVNFFDELLISDSIDRTISYTRDISSYILAGDRDSKAFVKLEQDITIILEEFKNVTNLSKFDTQSMSEVMSTITKFKRQITDIVSIKSSIDKSGMLKYLKDIGYVSDSQSKIITTEEIDTVLINEVLSKDYNKSFSDTMLIGDSFSRESI